MSPFAEQLMNAIAGRLAAELAIIVAAAAVIFGGIGWAIGHFW